MIEIIVTQTLVLYTEENRTIIGEVFAGDNCSVPEGVLAYVGTLEDFLIEKPEYDSSGTDFVIEEAF